MNCFGEPFLLQLFNAHKVEWHPSFYQCSSSLTSLLAPLHFADLDRMIYIWFIHLIVPLSMLPRLQGVLPCVPPIQFLSLVESHNNTCTHIQYELAVICAYSWHFVEEMNISKGAYSLYSLCSLFLPLRCPCDHGENGKFGALLYPRKIKCLLECGVLGASLSLVVVLQTVHYQSR